MASLRPQELIQAVKNDITFQDAWCWGFSGDQFKSLEGTSCLLMCAFYTSLLHLFCWAICRRFPYNVCGGLPWQGQVVITSRRRCYGAPWQLLCIRELKGPPPHTHTHTGGLRQRRWDLHVEECLGVFPGSCAVQSAHTNEAKTRMRVPQPPPTLLSQVRLSWKCGLICPSFREDSSDCSVSPWNPWTG